ncbi:pyridoxamine 5'-phosphate oxidase family protein [Streptomyces iconiensis]|uniref:Pyridoxamine 5'-phosphate oxidase family protein n=1 Tax=Streptomyces iconiensis TaxID=1384038 RepID=A0ABT6ZYF9_9ACTN|nr:pyridoxamine 5'-phosphate oxidase family protein [Streptomyces iconiensis]MDJ1134104.1 pyridoxamine 5'-phosphate oxidase family protein [Streptomyces iconiensis]
MALTPEERERFLSEPRIGALAVGRGEKRGPLNVPIWYQYEPGGELWVLTARDSVKAREIARAGRFTILAERLDPTVRYASAEGPVITTTTTTEAELREMTARYLRPDRVDAYVAEGSAEKNVTIRMRPEHWLAADLGAI